MHNHDENKQNSWMMWGMLICCTVPIVIILAAALGGKALGASNWSAIGLVTVMIVIHFLVMSFSHKKETKEDNKSEKDSQSQ